MDKVIVIAEAGVNHNGDLDNAIKLIDVAAKAGADFVKFQTFKVKNLVTKQAQKAIYQQENTTGSSSQFDMLSQLEIPADWYPKLLQRCKEKEIGFLSTGFDLESIDFLDQLGQKYFKVPSGEITHKSLLRRIAQKKKPVIISTGMATMQEIHEAVKVFLEEGLTKNNITILHCTTAYPTPLNEVNLMAMKTIENELGVAIGYSDHTLGTAVAIAAVGLGAKIIEKHFTLDKNLSGPDHKASLEPNELIHMVKAIREVTQSIAGTAKKAPTPTELENRKVARKSLCYSNGFEKGRKLREEDFIALRPEGGISPMLIDDFIGKSLKQSVAQNIAVNLNHFL
jgi:N,N'-diacetyllegionaminate synthase